MALNPSSLSAIKRAQKESLLVREISQLFMKTAMDDTRLQGLTINRVKLSPDKGTCYVFFYTDKGEDAFTELLDVLILYKPSLRKALAATIQSRYAPELVFKYDAQYEKELRLDTLLSHIKEQDQTGDKS